MAVILQDTFGIFFGLGRISIFSTMGRLKETMALNVEDKSEVDYRSTLTSSGWLSNGRSTGHPKSPFELHGRKRSLPLAAA